MKHLLVFVCFFTFLSCKKNDILNDKSYKLVVISPHQSRILNEFRDAFVEHYKNKFNKNVTIEYIDLGGSSNTLKYVLSEFTEKKEGIGIDLLWGGGDPMYNTLKEKKLLKRVEPDKNVLSKIPSELSGVRFYDKDFEWFGSALSSFGILCNKKLLEIKKIKQPETWEDLTKPQFYKQLIAIDPRQSGSGHTIYEIILQAYGWQKGWQILNGLAQNAKQFITSSDKVLKEVSEGEVACGFSVDFYAYSLISSLGKQNISFVMPRYQTILNADPIAMLKGASNIQIAEEFINFVLSEKGQTLFILPAKHPQGPKKKTLARLSVIPELYKKYENEMLHLNDPFKDFAYFIFDSQKGNSLWALLNDMMGSLLIDTKTPYGHKFTVPIDEKTAFIYAKKWKDELFRNKKVNEWLDHHKILQR